LNSFLGSDDEQIDCLENVSEEERNGVASFIKDSRKNFDDARENQLEKVVDWTTQKLDSRYVEHDVPKEKGLAAAVKKSMLENPSACEPGPSGTQKTQNK
jgi:hypothetical protein